MSYNNINSKVTYKKCTKCNCNFKLHIANRSLRRSCNYHNFINDYCFDCGLFRYQIKNSKCLHIYIKNDCLSCIIC